MGVSWNPFFHNCLLGVGASSPQGLRTAEGGGGKPSAAAKQTKKIPPGLAPQEDAVRGGKLPAPYFRYTFSPT